MGEVFTPENCMVKRLVKCVRNRVNKFTVCRLLFQSVSSSTFHMDRLRGERARFSVESGSLTYPCTRNDEADDDRFWDADSDEPHMCVLLKT